MRFSHLTFVFLALLVSNSHAQSPSDMFKEKPSVTKPADTSIFKERLAKDKNKSPLDEVVGEWLKQDKVELKKELGKKAKYCTKLERPDCSNPFITKANDAICSSGLVLMPTCDKKKARNGYSCSDQSDDVQKSIRETGGERDKAWSLITQKWHLQCDAFNKNGGKPTYADLAKIRAIDAEIASEKQAAERAAEVRAILASRREGRALRNQQSELAQKQAKEMRIRQKRQAEVVAAGRKRQENKMAHEAKLKRNAEQFYRNDAVYCGVDYSLAPQALLRKTCTR